MNGNNRLLIKRYTGVLIVTILLVLHLFISPQYGFTWDFHFHFFGGGKLLGIAPNVLEPRNLPFVEPDPRKAWTLPYGPLMSIPPVASYLYFHKTLGLLPADVSYHIPIIVWGVLGSLVLYLFLKEAVSYRAGVFAAVLLALIPRYFGDLHNNMKDIPSAVIFGANMWALWRLARYKRVTDLLLALFLFAAAFNIKINSVYIPVVFGVWIVFQWVVTRRIRLEKQTWLYILLAPVSALLLWWVFWTDPIGQLKHAYLTFGVGTNNIEVLLNGAWYCSGSTVPWYYPFWYLAVVTPISILFLALLGVTRVVKSVATAPTSSESETGVLFLVWFLVPLTRYAVPSIGVIDGIRHFEEVLLPIAALSGLALDWLYRTYAKKYPHVLIGFLCLLFAWLLSSIALYHPYEIAYFNELVGGAKGALGKYDLDYWGTSQKAAVEWINDHAPQNARVHIVMAAAVAGQYLRPDLLANLNTADYDHSDFVALLNRTSFLYRFYYAYAYFLGHRPVHTISVMGAPLVWIFDNRTNNVIQKQEPFWKHEDPCILKYWNGSRL